MPMVNGRSVSRVKYLISISLPSSKRWKSPFSRLPTRPFPLLRTEQRTFTRSTSTLIVVSCAGRARDNTRSGSITFIITIVDARRSQRVPMKKAITHLKKSDAVLAAIIDRAGAYKIRYAEPGFETLVRSIVSQQLNGRAADTIFGRLQ